MSAFPPPSWDFPINEGLLNSGTLEGTLEYQRNLVNRLTDVTSELSSSIYGESSKWTPVARGGTSAGAATSYGVQVGHYVRWGHMVWFTMNLQWNDADHTGTGNLEITGLPVASRNITNAKIVLPVYNAESGSEFVGVGFIEPNEKHISVIKSGATTQQINGADYDLQITGMYRTL